MAVDIVMPVRKTMNVSITPELERFVAGRVATGRYGSASEVVRAALRLLERDECAPPRRSRGVEQEPAS